MSEAITPHSPVAPAVARRPRVFYGWWIAIAATVQSLWTSGTFFFGFTAFFNPIVNEFGWSRAATAMALSLQRTESGVFGPFVGFIVDRWGARVVLMVGTVITALGFFWLARIHSLTTFYLAFGTVALGMSLASGIATTAVVGNWFNRMRGRAMTIAFVGGGFGGIMAPLLVWGIAHFGWRTMIDWIALGTLLVGIPASLVMRRRPEDYGYLPDGDMNPPQTNGATAETVSKAKAATAMPATEAGLSVREIMKTRAFWQIILGMGLSGLVMSTVVVFSIPVLESYGISSAVAGFTVLFISVLNLAGRFILGFMSDFMDKRKLLALTYLMLGLGSLALATIVHPWQIVLFLLFYSPGHGGTVPIRFSMIADYFGRKSYASIVGISMTLTAIFGIVGPVATGALYDATGSYRWAFVAIGLVAFIAVPATLTLKLPAAPLASDEPPLIATTTH
ncbi:MAG: MFS transporter [Chloroflexi bacterium]|nr:MFS transporter [Chloroflexota bacterium]